MLFLGANILRKFEYRATMRLFMMMILIMTFYANWNVQQLSRPLNHWQRAFLCPWKRGVGFFHYYHKAQVCSLSPSYRNGLFPPCPQCPSWEEAQQGSMRWPPKEEAQRPWKFSQEYIEWYWIKYWTEYRRASRDYTRLPAKLKKMILFIKSSSLQIDVYLPTSRPP